MDNRFPWMKPIRGAAKRFADEVCRRTGAYAAYNARTGGIYFYLDDMDQGITEVPFKGEAHRLPHPDETVKYIQLGRVPWRIKQKWMRKRQQFEQWDKEEAQESFFNDVRPEWMDRAKGRLNNRVTVSV